VKKVLSSERIGKENKNKNGSIMKIVDYIDPEHITIQFEDGYQKIISYSNFVAGSVKNPYDKTCYGVGYLGEGDYVSRVNKLIFPQYSIWHSMIERCYNKKSQEKYPTYIDCIVCDEWHNYQNFAKWYDDNYYEVEKGKMELDKDILVKGNKIYSPETCVFVPNKINSLFIKNDISRGESLIGMTYEKSSNKYKVNCSNKNNKTGTAIFIGRFATQKLAFNAYKEFKETYIKQIANEYRDKIPQKLYNAMCKYEVEITD